jgi:hypothetical protein
MTKEQKRDIEKTVISLDGLFKSLTGEKSAPSEVTKDICARWIKQMREKYDITADRW